MDSTEREEAIKALRWVDETRLYDDERRLKRIDKSFKGIRFMGVDHKKDKKYPTKAKIVYISRNHDYSSSELRKRIYQTEIGRVKKENYAKQCAGVIQLQKSLEY